MKLEALLFVDLLGVGVIAAVYGLLRSRNLSIGMGAWWIGLVTLLMVAMTVTPVRNLWFAASTALFQSPPFLIALTLVLLFFLLYLSVVVSTLQRQVRDISRYIALRDGRPAPRRSRGDADVVSPPVVVD